MLDDFLNRWSGWLFYFRHRMTLQIWMSFCWSFNLECELIFFIERSAYFTEIFHKIYHIALTHLHTICTFLILFATSSRSRVILFDKINGFLLLYLEWMSCHGCRGPCSAGTVFALEFLKSPECSSSKVEYSSWLGVSQRPPVRSRPPTKATSRRATFPPPTIEASLMMLFWWWVYVPVENSFCR